jgi:hypothetical protein
MYYRLDYRYCSNFEFNDSVVETKDEEMGRGFAAANVVIALE